MICFLYSFLCFFKYIYALYCYILQIQFEIIEIKTTHIHMYITLGNSIQNKLYIILTT